ncbi:hypothetical protein BX661DRAFT_175624 [Kickxella alabastrina]|uniref:uncharacterized protein n=1 Tax=Kickxella alabastrina TaxID=61397 RepID=UPI00221F9DFE|nr:uncharacterized protein BX661DRAFT_175624 [Kickxella alabastrina]KAI7834835.1 hypothetical protein BX661DRAFT_175624 [Kickxella alabastrina]KAJ1947138.1 hypothetical protein GGF37_000659 [Kickxella alabastrina]
MKSMCYSWMVCLAFVTMLGLLAPGARQTGLAMGSVIVESTNVTFDDRAAMFGSQLGDDGLVGKLMVIGDIEADNIDGCRRLATRMDSSESWIMLVERGGCGFVEKVRNMQASGAAAVLVGDPWYDMPITMYASGDTSDVHIPSSFVARSSYTGLRSAARNAHSPIEIKLVRNEYYELPFLDVLFITILSPLLMMGFIYVLYRLRLRQNRLRDLAPQDLVKSLPINTFNHAKYREGEPAECAICLDDFEDGDELRVLPCKHQYHALCIDRWLTTRKKFCPICKKSVCPSSETTPLLPARLRAFV